MNKIITFIWSLFKQFLIIIFYLIVVLGLQLLLYKYLDCSNPILEGSAYLFIELFTMLIFIIIFRKILIPDIIDFKKNGKQYIKDNYKYWLYGLLVMAISNIIISYFIGLASNESGNREMLDSIPIFSIISMVICAPIIEELMTRVILKDKVPNIVYYSLSGLIFGALHLLAATSLSEIFYIIPYGALGFSFAVIYQKSNNYLEKKDKGHISTNHIIDHFIFSQRLTFLNKTKKTYNNSSILEKIFGNVEKYLSIDLLNKLDVLYKDKDNIFENLDFINEIFIKKAKYDFRYLDYIDYVEETKSKLKLNANYDMSIDNLILKIWE